MTTKRKWTAVEEQDLVTMAKSGHGRLVIAEALNRSVASVQLKAFWLNVSVAEADQGKARHATGLDARREAKGLRPNKVHLRQGN